jgi:hypothetical protein
MRVIVYVEGVSDREAMRALLMPLLQRKREEGVDINFRPAIKGDAKKYVLLKVPQRAVDIILNDPYSVVVAMPDLYPKNKGFSHETFDELKAGIHKNFNDTLRARGLKDDIRLRDRFKIFCFKYDLEALVLAAEEALRSQLGIDHLKVTWQRPVEDQDHDHPPKQIVENLFREHGKRYRSTVARAILENSDYQNIADKCPQCFKPFVEFLTSLQPVSYHSQPC